MKIFGIDFTSAPRRKKPITLAVADLSGSKLTVYAIRMMENFAAFETWLWTPGPWVAGFDFPFGQPRRLIEALAWPLNWEDYVAKVGGMTKPAFETTLKAYRDGQPPGQKHHRRETDRLAGAVSPMMLYGVPVGKMFFEGAPCLLRAGVSVLPCRPTSDERIALEVYPALAARRWIGREKYKSDTRRKQTLEQQDNRARILQSIQSTACRELYGFDIQLVEEVARTCLEDRTGDLLDAILGVLPAAWAASYANQGYGIPGEVDQLEGWIVDPGLVK